MVKVTSVKKLLILVVALLVCATFIFAACDNGNFKPVSKPEAGEVDSNGGVAVRYGEWLYYVNGYQADASADNSYSNDVVKSPRAGSVVRIKLAEIEELFALSEKEYGDEDEFDNANDAIADYVRKHAETVVPKIYFSSNTNESTIQFAGIHIFGDRIYITTPNDKLTAGGNPLTSELVLMSFGLDGSNPVEHFTFTDNTTQIWLTETQEGKVVATYYTDSNLYTLDVASGTSTLIEYDTGDESYDIDSLNNVATVNWDKTGNCVFFINSVGEICKLNVGETSYEVVVENGTYELHEDHIEEGTLTFTIKSVNDGHLYYSKSDSKSSQTSNKNWYYINTADSNEQEETEVAPAVDTDISGAVGWRDGYVAYVNNKKDGLYGINLTTGNCETKIEILSREYNDSAITIDKIEGDTLYYTAGSVTYTIALTDDMKSVEYKAEGNGVPFAYSATTTGWALPDYLNVEVEVAGDEDETTTQIVHYVFTVTTGNISVVKFDVETKKNSDKSVNLTLKAA